MIKYRLIEAHEINQLVVNGCSADDWRGVEVEEGFDSFDLLRNCRFEGVVKIGCNTSICNIGQSVRNCIIGRNSVIVDTGVVECNCLSSFGCGLSAVVINEGGGREVVLNSALTAQTAYIESLYRHRPATVERLKTLAAECDGAGNLSLIGDNVRIAGCRTLRNVNIGSGAVLEDVSIVSNCTVLSCEGVSATIGEDVKLYDSIVCAEAHIVDNTILHRCFVGQAVRLGNFTAADSLLFACSQLENGEACSLFAGPFTVSHHASSLLIAGMFSFFNAGSGTNQSNHLFKTGAVHQGIHARGCKFGSDAYQMLPARNGAFTVVLGRHTSHPDTDNFPFSILVEQQGRSCLLPARNIAGYGTLRDMAKWPARDDRKGKRRDVVNFAECNPYLGERMVAAIDILSSLSSTVQDEYAYNRIMIKPRWLRNGLELYRLALDKTIGRLLQIDTTPIPCGTHWIDVAGEFMPQSQMELLLDDVDSGAIDSYRTVVERFESIDEHYLGFALFWALDRLERQIGHKPTQSDIQAAVEAGDRASQRIAELIEEDREKDFSQAMMTGYGIDSLSDEQTEADFKSVRGF